MAATPPAKSERDPLTIVALVASGASALAAIIALLLTSASNRLSIEANANAEEANRLTLALFETQAASDNPAPSATFAAHLGALPVKGCVHPDGRLNFYYGLLEHYIIQNNGSRPVALLSAEIGIPDLLPDIDNEEILFYTRGDYFGSEDSFRHWLNFDDANWNPLTVHSTKWTFISPPFSVPIGDPLNLLIDRRVVIVLSPTVSFDQALEEISDRSFADDPIFGFGDGSQVIVHVGLGNLLHFQEPGSSIFDIDPSTLSQCP
jgi:hypothetical protein